MFEIRRWLGADVRRRWFYWTGAVVLLGTGLGLMFIQTIGRGDGPIFGSATLDTGNSFGAATADTTITTTNEDTTTPSTTTADTSNTDIAASSEARTTSYTALSYGTLPDKFANFSQTKSKRVRELFHTVLEHFVDVAETHNLTYMLYFGSLIGSLRHHGPIPWDYDIDLVVDLNQREQIEEVLTKHIREPCYVEPYQDRWRIRHREKRSRQFLDLFPLKAEDGMFRKNPVSEVFPLGRRPFWGLWMNAPRLAHRVVEASYGNDTMDLCVNTNVKPTGETPCSELKPYYPFTENFRINATHVNETLVLNETIIDWNVVQNY